ncbi:uncharacterized protein BCR38DRAFT_362324 [Pseudomassariella vexata]|uniref:FAD-binding PCMH-type domain-containing protein n=1 Tax=Pseudomassariella vexata TaxID=1141098 RepID=A0A1Y2EFX1_9PEZI|nr:uncharacterized protein BCR38DRAFT_362324 [Pseudomassariella vexata]ORY70472.1 hypothetical protein BCR38DRAFT_362324 [Pseudomassariella vexata]
MMVRILLISVGFILSRALEVACGPIDTTELTNIDVAGFPPIVFAEPYVAGVDDRPGCREVPGSDKWPSEQVWDAFNETLGGVLLKPPPAGAFCYEGPYYSADLCAFLQFNATFTSFWLDDPVDVLTRWPTGSTCLPTLNPQGNCTQGGLPTYVVNATSVKHVQAAVNFARNQNIRLVIKNTGHDFGGRSTGASSLSIWTHYLKGLEFIPKYSIANYTGPAIHYGAGIQSWELNNAMVQYNVTLLAPAVNTVGAGGGWLAAGGHTTVTSTFGLGSDQVLSLQVVTANGRLVTVDQTRNEDLFFALRGGGGATYGVVVSVIAKAHPRVNTTGTSLNLSYDPLIPPTNATSNSTFQSNYYVKDVETFWAAANAYYTFARNITKAGGLGFTYIYPLPNNSLSLIATNTLVNKSPDEFFTFMQPLYDDLHAAGVNVPNTKPLFSSPYGTTSNGGGSSPNNRRYSSRLIPSTHWDDAKLFSQVMSAIRTSVTDGYIFHGTIHAPTYSAAGYPGEESAVNPAWRNASMHAMLFYKDFIGVQTAAEAAASQVDMNAHIELLRELTPGSGAYMNEADPAEPDWQGSFFGYNYPRLLDIKLSRDPWGVFWAPTTVGSDRWVLKTKDGFPFSEDGRLCRA